LHLALNADVTVTGKRTCANLADVENPAENLASIAQAASQGAITARQVDERELGKPDYRPPRTQLIHTSAH
jgi:hypothetical protein